MMRYFLEIAYKGTDFCGFQVQNNAKTVQGELNKALSVLLKMPTETIGSGRTDTGVHCKQQFLHLDISQTIQIDDLVHRLNRILPNSIAVLSAKAVKENAHARFDALSRSYEYYICEQKNPFSENLAYFYPLDLDIEKMNQAARYLLLYRDFESFSKTKTDVKTFFCDIKEAFWQKKEAYLVFYITADRFLRGMVRAIVGTLLEIGRGKMEVADFEQIILQKNRNKAGRAVPPQGLYLVNVHYPTTVFLP